ncbi:MAG: carboxypeptidase M32 [Lachnospiraceae bacterium]|nr:carboxypeptidase M32 [Lachnospiraceae bacterium]
MDSLARKGNECMSDMTKVLNEKLQFVTETLETAEKYEHALHVLNFDMETLCPAEGMEEEGETIAFLSTQAYKLLKTDEFTEAAEYLYEHRFGSGTEDAPGDDALGELDRVLAENLHREYAKIKNITPEMNHEFTLTFNKAYIDWLNAKTASDYGIFAPSLAKVREINFKDVSLRTEKKASVYDSLLDDYERGITADDLDEAFGECKERLIPFLEKIRNSGKVIRTDFLHRTVKDEQQRAMTQYLLETIGYDFRRGAFATTEHPFTDDLAKNDVRITTHYYPEMFCSNLYSTIHEGGHAIFGQLQPYEHHGKHIANEMTLGMHESVSRFYENRIGRSEAFTGLIFDRTKEIFPGILDDVSPREFYEGVNAVRPSLIRTEADEFTYTFHIIIRYEIEKMIVNGNAPIEDLPRIWNEKYRDYLGVMPANDAEGILQDVHWSGGFGYFPTYALGNMYNAMYYNRMKNELDVERCVSGGDFASINGWMKENVFAKANLLEPKEWIRDITGRSFTPKDFLDYLEEKYGALYGIE